MREIELSVPQSEFILAEEPYPLFCGGFGAGKSLTMAVAIAMDLELGPGVKLGAYAPTYDLLKLITIPYITELLEDMGEPFKLNKSDHIFFLSDKRQIICRSMDNPARIVGYQTLRAHVDELDTLKEVQAEEAWNKIIARNRQKIYQYDENDNKILLDGWRELDPDHDPYKIVSNGVRGYTTPEGFRFAYKRWKKEKRPGYALYKAPTHSNKHLPADYIDNLRASYPAQLIEAYIEGEFVNLTSGAVYPEFDRILNHSDEIVKRGDILHIGMDFNVNQMAAGIHVIREGKPIAVDEITNGRDTASVCDIIKERYRGHKIIVYPDATGRGTSSKSASMSDISIIKGYQFQVKADSKNPRIKDRVISVNAAICNSDGERFYKVNTKMCPSITDCLEQQVYDKNGQPDKSSGNDHHTDEVGYFIFKNWPIVKKTAKMTTLRAFAR